MSNGGDFISKSIFIFLSIIIISVNTWAAKGFHQPKDFFTQDIYGAIYKYKMPVDSSLGAATEQYFYNGSMVAVSEKGQQVMWTNFHLVRHFVVQWSEKSQLTSAEDIQREIKKVNLPIILKNSSGKVVFNSYAEPEKYQAHFINVDWSQFVPGTSYSGLGTPDAVKIKLSQNLEHQLERGEKIGLAEDIYIIGYPKPTDDRKEKYQQPDSDGRSQYITYGQVISAASLIEDYNLSPYSLKFGLNEDDNYVFNSDCEQGMSGGAIVNSQGQFAGLFKGIYSPKEHGPIACLALKPRALRFFEILTE